MNIDRRSGDRGVPGTSMACVVTRSLTLRTPDTPSVFWLRGAHLVSQRATGTDITLASAAPPRRWNGHR